MNNKDKKKGIAEVFVDGVKIGEISEGGLANHVRQHIGAPDIQKLDRPQPLGKKMDMDLYK